MESLLEELEGVRLAPVRGTEDAERASEAARLVGQWADLEGRIRSFLTQAGQPLSTDTGLGGKPMHEAVAEILHGERHGLHVREIARRLYDGGWRHPKPPYVRPDRIENHLTAMFQGYQQKFSRVAPRTYANAENLASEDAAGARRRRSSG